MQDEQYTQDEISQAAELYPSLWVRKHGILNEAGIPIEFSDRKFLVDIYDDMSQFQVILKAPQVGMTTTQVIKCLYLAKKKSRQIIYTLPTATDVYDMVGGSFNRLIAQNPILSQWVKQGDTMEHKIIDDGLIRFRGTFTAKQAMMIPSDQNVHDEVDASDQTVITLMETRLQAKPGGGRWYFSHPSLVGMGVDIYWQQSDQKEWFINCPHCKKEQQLKWPENIDIQTRQYICQMCKGILTNDSRRNGCWKPTAAGIFSGYHVSQLMCAWIPASKIVEDYLDPNKDKQYFWNYVLGLPYIGSENKIEPSVVLKNVTGVENLQQGRIIIGVDTGLPIHYVCMNKDGVFFYKTCNPPSATYDPYDELERLLKHFPRSILVSDQGGDLIGIRRLQTKYPGRVFLCYYRKDRKTEKMIQWGEDKAFGTVLVDRNRMMSLTIEHLREPGLIRLNGKPEEWELFASHFGNIYRELVVKKEAIGKDDHTLYGNEYIWKRNGPDHFVHCLIYALTGMDKYGEDLAQIIKGRDRFMEGVPVGSGVHGEVSGSQAIKKKMKQGIAGYSKVDF